MRPRERSYGDSSTFTLSPGRMRMKCIRIFPEMCARTLCPLSSCTRNIALGKGSITVPSTSIASSFGNQKSRVLRAVDLPELWDGRHYHHVEGEGKCQTRYMCCSWGLQAAG